MIDAIVKKLKTGSVKNVVAYPYAVLPSPPYVVVKEEPSPGLNRTNYRIIPHFSAGQIFPLRKYTRKETYDLLNEQVLVSAETGAKNQIMSSGEISGAIVENDDKTISSERLFYVADIF
jgi:hypothetical protein